MKHTFTEIHSSDLTFPLYGSNVPFTYVDSKQTITIGEGRMGVREELVTVVT